MSLKKLIELENEASEFGFCWENETQILQQIQSECTEIKENLMDANHLKLKEEIGDLLHAAFSLCIFCQFDPEETLEKSIAKFERRLKLVKEIAKEKGLSNLKGFSFVELMRIWDEAKERIKNQLIQ